MQNPQRMVCTWALLASCLPALLWAGEKVDSTQPLQPGQRVSLSFEDISGDIDIQGWDQASVQVRGTTGGRDWEDGDRLDVEASSGEVSIAPRGRYRSRDRVHVDLQIRVPHEVDLRIHTATHLKVTDVNGRHEVSVGNGNVDLTRVRGEGRFSCANGRMTLQDCNLDGDISNVNGRLRIDASDIQGEVSAVNSSMEVSNASEGIELSSVNGHIELGSAAQFVQVSTTNGNVDIDELDGWIDAETVNGTVRVRMVGPPQGRRTVDIETLNGDVELEIPENYSLDFDVRIESRGGNDRYRVDSDFALDIRDDGGRREQRIRATGKLNQGEHRVRIRATNGDVILRRLASAR